jgi:type IV pilus assembly protein PilW
MRNAAGNGSVPRFSLIEIMVGLAIGLASMLAIYQLYATSEGRRRTIVSISEAQTAGSMALFAIERDIRSAGLGFASIDARYLNCSVKAYNRTQHGRFRLPLLPVRIADGRIWVLTGSSSNMFAGARYVDSSGGEFKMERSNAGFQAGDVILGTSDSFTNNCLLMEVTAGADPTSATAAANKNKVHRKTGTYQDYYQGKEVDATRNDGAHISLLDSSKSSLGEGMLYSLGPEPTLTVWSVDDKKQLTRYNHLDETETGKVAVAHDILQLQAEYGYDANANGAIDEEAEWTASLPPVQPGGSRFLPCVSPY